jgi:AraC-like DNA-binding protein
VNSLFLDLHRGSEVDQPKVQQADHFRSFVTWFRDNIDAFGPRTHTHRLVDRQLGRARDLIADAVFKNTLIDSIAEEVGLSAYALIRRFKKVYGISPHAWRMQARANAAARLLSDNAPLADVAGSCGFADQSHMSRIFKSGQISQYTRSERQGLRNFGVFLDKCVKLQGFRIGSHLARRDQALDEMMDWFRAGHLKFREPVAEGLEAAPAALVNMLSGGNIGSVVAIWWLTGSR